MKIAIDGPSGAGKSTLSKDLAKALGFIYIDTGAMYRVAALACLRNNVDVKSDPECATKVVQNAEIDVRLTDDGQHIFLDKEDVNSLIRTPQISMAASAVSAIPEVRICLVELQRKLAETKDVIMDGRDIGTYVLPDAPIKIFLTASPEERAKRRYLELQEKGVSCDYDTVLAELKERDHNDSTRSFAPLKPAEDSILIDTSNINYEESFNYLLKIITERL